MRWILNVFVLFAILATIHCALAQSPDLQQIPWLPRAIASWANDYPAFRNFPAFGVVAMSLYFCVFSWIKKPHPKRLLGLALFCSIVVSLFGVLLECLQLFLPARVFDPYDILWSIAGAFAGSILAFSVSICLISRK
jgi:VanZ family protein